MAVANVDARIPLSNSARVGILIAAAWDLATAWAYWRVWSKPGSLWFEQDVKWLVGVMLVEFLLIHAAVFMGNIIFSDMRWLKKTSAILLLGGFYGLMALGFAMSLKSNWPLLVIALMVLEKLWAAFLGRDDSLAAKAELYWSWAMSTALYLLAMGLTVPWNIPSRGVTPAVVADQGFLGGGLWESQPHYALCAGLIYFGVLGLARLYLAGRGSVVHPNKLQNTRAS